MLVTSGHEVHCSVAGHIRSRSSLLSGKNLLIPVLFENTWGHHQQKFLSLNTGANPRVEKRAERQLVLITSCTDLTMWILATSVCCCIGDGCGVVAGIGVVLKANAYLAETMLCCRAPISSAKTAISREFGRCRPSRNMQCVIAFRKLYRFEFKGIQRTSQTRMDFSAKIEGVSF